MALAMGHDEEEEGMHELVDSKACHRDKDSPEHGPAVTENGPSADGCRNERESQAQGQHEHRLHKHPSLQHGIAEHIDLSSDFHRRSPSFSKHIFHSAHTACRGIQ